MDYKAIAEQIGPRVGATQEWIFHVLREGIISGKLPGGMQLKQDEISAALNVSHIPVREALRRLEAQGLVRIHANRGAAVTELTPVGMGPRGCVGPLSRFIPGQGMLVGNSAAFTFLVNAETEHNEYVASRPFRVNAGGVHSYALMPGDRTAYLDELHAGSEVLIVDHKGDTFQATVGRVKVEQRPMLRIEAAVPGGPSGTVRGTVFLQNAETIRLVEPGGRPISVVDLAPGSRVLVRLDAAGRHFGMRISEDITEG